MDDSLVNDVVLTPQAFADRLNKASLSIRHVMKSPDIIGVQEMENLATLTALAAKVNADALAETGVDPGYQAILLEGNDLAGIDVGLLVKSGSGLRMIVDEVQQVGLTETFAPDNSPLNEHPPLVVKARIFGPVGVEFPVTVVVSHLQSLSGIAGAGGDRIRQKRAAQAEFLANELQNHQGEALIAIGDYNAFQFNDGWVDVIGTIKGQPAPADQVVVPAGDLVTPDLVALDDALGAQQYSFLFDGNALALDHVLVNSEAKRRFTRIVYARSNADFPESLRSVANRPERLSDHDMPVAYFSFPGAPSIALNGMANVTVEWATAFVDPGVTASDPDYDVAIELDGFFDPSILGDYTLVYTADNGFLTSSVSRMVHVVDTTAPVLALMGDAAITVEAATTFTDPGATATDDRAGDLTSAILVSGSVPLNTVGTYTLTYSVTDGYNTASTTRTVTVVDTTAPVVTLKGSAAVTVEGATAWVDPGATASDSRAGDLTAAIVVTGTVNTVKVGAYTRTYTVSDGYNTSSATRVVTVVDTTKPVLTLNGGASLKIQASLTPWHDPGATATDTLRGNLTSAIVVSGAVNTKVPGTYTLTYSVSDGYNTVTAKRTVKVVDTTRPIIFGLGTSQDFSKSRNQRIDDVTVHYTAFDVTALPACSLSVSVVPSKRDKDWDDDDRRKGRDKDWQRDDDRDRDDITWAVLDAHHVRFTWDNGDDERKRQYDASISCVDGSGNRSVAVTRFRLLRHDRDRDRD